MSECKFNLFWRNCDAQHAGRAPPAMRHKKIRVERGCLSPIGAGEEIRTLDPNLGKVMLYP